MLSTVAPPRLFAVGLDGSAPREVLGAFLSQFEAHGVNNMPPASTAWHPDGRVSFWGWRHEKGDSFWTVRLDGSLPIQSKMDSAVARRFEELHVAKIAGAIRWSRSGRALYFSGGSFVGSSQVNVWRIDVDPETLRWIGGPHRLTTSGEGHESLALSTDGARLAFTSRITTRRIMSLPIDHGRRRLNGEARALAPAESFAFQPDVTRDGDRLAFMVDRSGGKGGFETRTRSLVDDQEALVVSWGPLTESSEGRIGPRWSPDGTRLAYAYWNLSVGEGTRAMVADARTGSEQPITSLVPTAFPFDWSNDGKWLLASLKRRAADPVCVWTVPLPAAPDAEKDARLIASDAHYELWQPRFSRDNRWVVFNAVAQPDQSWSTLYVVPASGGSWTQITEGSYWDDKPRWSPDGKSIYFISSREGLFNVWVVAFDPERGLVEGHPVRVTAFTGPGRQLLPNVIIGDIAVSGDRLFVCLEEASGSIWTLDKVDR